MNRTLKLKQTEEQKVYFTSDFHINHNPKWPVPIWKDRGFNSVVEMNDAIITSINNVVRHTDVLIFLGDFVLNCSESQFEEFLSRINCQTIYMLFGNHNSCVWNIYQREIQNFFRSMDDDFTATQPKPDVEIYPFKYRNIIFIGNYAEVNIDGKMFILNHFPIHSWNSQKQGSVHLYGHQHCKNNPVGGRRMDVGWDRDKRPYSADEIWNNLSRVSILSDGGHH